MGGMSVGVLSATWTVLGEWCVGDLFGRALSVSALVCGKVEKVKNVSGGRGQRHSIRGSQRRDIGISEYDILYM